MRTFDEAKEEFEKEYLRRLLAATKGNFQEAARLAQRQRSGLYYLAKKHGLKPSDWR
jgi:two-component system response regulator GlrR